MANPDHYEGLPEGLMVRDFGVNASRYIDSKAPGLSSTSEKPQGELEVRNAETFDPGQGDSAASASSSALEKPKREPKFRSVGANGTVRSDSTRSAPSSTSRKPKNQEGRQRSMSAETIEKMEFMKQKAKEARRFMECQFDSDSSKDDENAASLPQEQPYHSFVKMILDENRLMRTITEESRSSISYTISVRNSSLRRDREISRSTLRKLPSFYNPLRVDAKIAEFDKYLKNPESYHDCFRERLWEIRGVFDDFRERRTPRDIEDMVHLSKLDREVQVSRHAQQNIKESTHLLLHTNHGEHMKRSLRSCLYFAEDAARPSPDRDNRQALEELKRHATVTKQKLTIETSVSYEAMSEMNEAVTKSDAIKVRCYFQKILELRYEHIPSEFREQYVARVDCSHVRPLATFLKWKATRDKAVGLALAQSLDLHPVELNHVLQPRLDRLLDEMWVDSEYVKARLLDLDNIWAWVYGYNRMAHHAEWRKLAGQFFDDQAQFERIFSGPLVYADPDRRIVRSNIKARVQLGMWQVHGHYFTRIDDPDHYELSKTAKQLDRAFRQEQERLRKEERERERTAFRLGKLKDWMKRKRDKIAVWLTM